MPQELINVYIQEMADRDQPVDPYLIFLLNRPTIEEIHERSLRDMIRYLGVESSFTPDGIASPTQDIPIFDDIFRTILAANAIPEDEDYYRGTYPEYGVVSSESYDQSGFIQHPLPQTETTSDDIENPCGMCFSKPTEMVFTQCGHFYGCKDCVDRLNPVSCLVCKSPSHKVRIVHISSLCEICNTSPTEMVFTQCGHFYSCQECCYKSPTCTCPVCDSPSYKVRLINV